MPMLVWDKVGEHFYETGIDRGVFYPQSEKGVAWSGLISVTETMPIDVQPVYFDGVKINDTVKLGDFTGSLSAFTYPDVFDQYIGFDRLGSGVFLGEQPVKTFGLSYRSKVGNELDPNLGYKIHLLYNLTAKPSSINYKTVGNSPEAIQFQWDITSVPEIIEGFRPSSHLIFDTTIMDPTLVNDLEEILYGTELNDARLPHISDIQEILEDFYLIKIVDHGNGTWSAITHVDHPEFITIDENEFFTITSANAIFVGDADFYLLSDTLDESDIG